MNKAIGGAVAVALALAPLPAAAGSPIAGVPSAGGMGSPDAAVQEFLDAARASDPLGLLAVLEPSERSLVKTLYERGGAAAESAGGVDIDALLLALHIDIRSTPLTVEQLADDVAWVTTDEVAVDVGIDMAAADAALAVDLSDTEFDGAGFELTPAFDDLGIAVVREGDAWFVSALYTAAEIGRRGNREAPAFITPVAVAPAATPDAAVAALLAGVSAKDPAATAAALTSFEGGLVADYTGNVGAALLEAVAPYSLTITPERMQIVEQTDSRAVVEVVDWTARVTGGTDEYDQIDSTLDVSGECGSVRTLDYDGEYEDDTGCLFDNPTILDPLSVLPEFGWAGVRLVVVNENGGWRVSLLESVLNTIAPTITDAVSAAGIAEVAGYFTAAYYIEDGFYETLATLAGAGASSAPAGQSVIVPSANGRVAVFAVDGPATVSVDVEGAADEWSCVMYVNGGSVGEESDYVSPFGQCGETARVESGRAVVVVTEGGALFSANEPIGTVTATVTPG